MTERDRELVREGEDDSERKGRKGGFHRPSLKRSMLLVNTQCLSSLISEGLGRIFEGWTSRGGYLSLTLLGEFHVLRELVEEVVDDVRREYLWSVQHSRFDVL